jgi:hypothetical protein
VQVARRGDLGQAVGLDGGQTHLFPPAIDVGQQGLLLVGRVPREFAHGQFQGIIGRAEQESGHAHGVGFALAPAGRQLPGGRLAVREGQGVEEGVELLLVFLDGVLGAGELEEPEAVPPGDDGAEQAVLGGLGGLVVLDAFLLAAGEGDEGRDHHKPEARAKGLHKPEAQAKERMQQPDPPGDRGRRGGRAGGGSRGGTGLATRHVRYLKLGS